MEFVCNVIGVCVKYFRCFYCTVIVFYCVYCVLLPYGVINDDDYCVLNNLWP